VPKLVDFSIGGSATVELASVNGRLGAFREAVRWGVGPLRIDAPFRKLAVELLPDFMPTPANPRRVMNAIGVGQVLLTYDPRPLVSLDPGTVRQTAAELTAQALDIVEAELAWRDTHLDRLVVETGAHVGRYEIVWGSLAVRDRRAHRRYVPVLSWDESSTLVRLDARDPTDATVASTMIKSSDRVEMAEFFFDPRRATLVEGRIEYRDRWGEIVASVEVPHG